MTLVSSSPACLSDTSFSVNSRLQRKRPPGSRIYLRKRFYEAAAGAEEEEEEGGFLVADEARALPPAAGPGDTRIDSTSISLFHRPEFELFDLAEEEEDKTRRLPPVESSPMTQFNNRGR